MSEHHNGTESNGNAPAPWLTFTVTPAPAADERDALIAAVTAFLAARPAPTVDDAPAAPRSRWREAGRRAAVRGIAKGAQMGWGRRSAGWR